MGLQSLSRAQAFGLGTGESMTTQLPMLRRDVYGPLVPDPDRVFDLPQGFRYEILARQGDRMDDGLYVPGKPDGMAAFATDDGRIGLICNHELSDGDDESGPFGRRNHLLQSRHRPYVYDYGKGDQPQLGGTTTLILNPKTGQKELQYLSLAGTDRNCAGGPTPWGSWITCEETNLKAFGKIEKDHGYNFEVPLSTRIQPVRPVALEAMGRFRHEAVAVDPRTGIVYQTEDMGDGLIYRFIPKVNGKLQLGGQLQALAILDEPSRDTRNWKSLSSPTFPSDTPFSVRWIDIEDVTSPDDNLRFQGFEKGAARFARGEGMWYGQGEVFFACTNGGPIEKGQVFRYTPSTFEGTDRETEAPGKLELFIESTDKDVLKNCDNLTVAPWGDLFICEDSESPCNLVGITPDGACFEFGSNRYNDSELAGVCFDPSGRFLFLNIQTSGLTLAITGPWQQT